MPRKNLSLPEARRVALAAQGFDKPRPACVPTRAHMRRVVRQLGLLQLNFVNLLVPAHYLVVYSRLGPYQRGRFNDLVYEGRDFTEYWPLLQYRRDEYKPGPNSPIMKMAGRDKYLDIALERVQATGPLLAGGLPPLPGPPRKQGDWHRSVPGWALEFHFGRGRVSVVNRLPSFQRLYDLPERVIDEPHFCGGSLAITPSGNCCT